MGMSARCNPFPNLTNRPIEAIRHHHCTLWALLVLLIIWATNKSFGRPVSFDALMWAVAIVVTLILVATFGMTINLDK